LYDKVYRIPWENYISEDGYVSVTSSVNHPEIKDDRHVNLKTKDAIVDRLRRQKGRRPDSGSRLDGTVIFIYWQDGHCRVFLDTSGESLSRRGYRTENHQAPMQETLAAALLYASRWEPGHTLVNPMCGSGTIAIEAALMALKRPAGTLRHQYGFKEIKGFDTEAWDQLRSRLKQESLKETEAPIIATDHDPRAITAARKNAQTAGVEQLINFQEIDFRETPLPEGSDGSIVIMNPPYGDRMGNYDSLGQLYEEIGDFFKQECTSYTGYVFTGNLELAKHIGLRTNRRVEFYNSTIDARLLEYELFDGSRY
jgi:putative N6-adenine-specific DNA methylase